MNNFLSSKVCTAFGLMTLLSVFAAACTLPTLMVGAPTQQTISGDINICHIDGDEVDYTPLKLKAADLKAHSKHPDDIIPAPADGCPDEVVAGGNDGKITICHATNSASNPYNKITIALSGLNGHSKHAKDFIPESEDADCSVGTPTITLTPTITPTMDGTATVTATITTTPTITVTPTPEGTDTADDGKKITICHATGSKKNRYVEITISINGLNGHNKHPNDIIPAPAGGCPQ